MGVEGEEEEEEEGVDAETLEPLLFFIALRSFLRSRRLLRASFVWSVRGSTSASGGGGEEEEEAGEEGEGALRMSSLNRRRISERWL